MKYIVLCLIIILLNLSVSAQLIKNRGFESWVKDSTLCPTGYECSNMETWEQHGFENTMRDSSAFSGNYALTLETHIVGNDTLFGYIINGDFDSNTGGDPFNTRPDSMAGYYKCDVKPGDTALVLSVFRKGSTPIGMCIGKIVGQQNSYQRFSFPITWLLPGNPDSMLFAAASSNAIDEIGVAHGSKLTIDSVHFIGSTQIPPNNDFENWSFLYNEKPMDWGTMNDYSGVSRLGLLEKLSGTDAYSGNYSIRVKNLIKDGDTIHGIVANRPLGDTWNYGGYAFSKQVDTLTGYYRYWTPQTDSATAYVKLWNSLFDYHFVVKLPPASKWTYFEVPLHALTPPDSMQLTLFAGNYEKNFVYSGAYLDLDELDMKICDLPAMPSAIMGPDSLCNTAKTAVFSVNTQSDADGFSWTLPAGISISSTPPDSNAIVVSIDSATAASGNLGVSAMVYCGMSSASSKALEIVNTPVTPVISRIADTLTSYVVADQYSWFKNGIALNTNAAKIGIDTAQSANYTLVVSNWQCHSDTAYFEFVSTVGMSSSSSKSPEIEVYPNPLKHSLNVRSEYLIEKVEILDVSGRLVLQKNQPSAEYNIPVDFLNAGVYMVQVYTHSRTTSYKIIKE